MATNHGAAPRSSSEEHPPNDTAALASTPHQSPGTVEPERENQAGITKHVLKADGEAEGTAPHRPTSEKTPQLQETGEGSKTIKMSDINWESKMGKLVWTLICANRFAKAAAADNREEQGAEASKEDEH